MERTNQAAQKLAETTRDSYQTVVDHVVGLQERNARFARGVVDGSIQELRHQVESQRDAYQALIGQSLDAYMDPAYAPLSYYKEGLRAANSAAK